MAIREFGIQCKKTYFRASFIICTGRTLNWYVVRDLEYRMLWEIGLNLRKIESGLSQRNQSIINRIFFISCYQKTILPANKPSRFNLKVYKLVIFLTRYLAIYLISIFNRTCTNKMFPWNGFFITCELYYYFTVLQSFYHTILYVIIKQCINNVLRCN